MKMMPIESSAVSKVGYNRKTKSLRVQFPSGTFAQYKDVPSGVFDGLLASESAGEYFNTRVRKAFDIDSDVE